MHNLHLLLILSSFFSRATTEVLDNVIENLQLDYDQNDAIFESKYEYAHALPPPEEDRYSFSTEISVSDLFKIKNTPVRLGYSIFNVEIGKYKYIVQKSDGKLYSLSDLVSPGQEILLTNKYTKDPNECSCGNNDTKNCNCCYQGACPCPYNNLCAPCGLLESRCYGDELTLNENKKITVIPGKHRKTIFTANGNTLTSYNLINAVDNYFLRKEKNFQIDGNIAAVRQGETYSYDNYKLRKRTFLILLLENSVNHYFYELIENENRQILGKRYTWFTPKFVTAKTFEVFQSGPRILVGYTVDDNLYINVLQEYQGGEFRIYNLQNILHPGILSWNYRNTENQQVIATMGLHYTILYEFDTEYNPYQHIPHENGNKYGIPLEVLFLKGKQNEQLILSLVFKCGIMFYSHHLSDGKFRKLSVLARPSCTYTSAFKYEFENSGYLVLSTSEDPNSKILKVSLKKGENDDYGSKYTPRMEKLEIESASILSKLDKIEAKYISELNALEKATEEINADEFSTTEKSVGGIEDSLQPLRPLIEIENKMNKIKFFLENSEDKLNDIVYRNYTGRWIEGDKDVNKAVINHMLVKNSYIGIAIGRVESIEDTLQKLVRIDDKRIIKGVKIFNGDIQMEDLRPNYINGIDVNKIVMEDRAFELEGANFNSGLFIKNDLKIQDRSTIFGVDLSRETISLSDNAKLGKCLFRNLKAHNGIEVLEKRINNDHIDNLMRSANSFGDVLTISDSAFLKNLTILGNLEANSVMNENAEKFLQNLINLNQDVNLKKVIFDDVTVANLTAESVNGEVFPRDFVTRGSSSITDFGNKIFDQVVFGDLSVGGSVNGIKTDSVVTKTSPQIISGTKSFKNGMKIFGDLKIKSSKLDGVDLSFAQHETDSFKNGQTTVFKSAIITPEIRIKGNINSGNINSGLLNLLNDLAFVENGELRIYGKKKFKTLEVKRAKVRDINTINPSTFVNTKFENTINEKKIFTNDLSFENLYVEKEVDGTNLEDLFVNALCTNKINQIIRGSKIANLMTCKEINVRNSVNGILTSDFLRKSGDQYKPNSLYLNRATFHSLKVNQLRLPEYSTINKLPLKNIERDIELSSFGPDLTIYGNLFVKTSFSANTINNESVNKLFQVLKDKTNNIIVGNINFDNLNVDGPLTSNGFINNLNFSDLIMNSIKKFGNNYISGTSWNEIEVPSMQVDSLVNNINFERLADDVVYTNENLPYFKGEKTFIHGFKLKGNLESEFINSVDLAKKILLKGKPQIITAPYTFEGIKVQNAKINYFNDKSLRNLQNTDVPNLVMSGPAMFTGYVSSRSVEADGLVLGLDLKSTLLDAVKINSSKIIMTGEKSFYRPPTFNDLYITDLNGQIVDYESLHRKSFETKIKKLTVNGKLKTHSIKTHTATIEGKFGELLSLLTTDAKFITDNDYNLKLNDIRVKGDLTVNKLNGYNTGEDFISTKAFQSFSTDLHLGTAVFRNLTVFGSIKDVRLPSKITTNGNVITKIFKGNDLKLKEDLIVNGNVNAQSLGTNELLIPDSLVLTKIAQRLNGSLDFSESITANKVSSYPYLLNGVDFSPRSFPGLYTDYFNRDSYNWTSDKLVNDMELSLKAEYKKIGQIQDLLKETLVVPHSLKLISKSEFIRLNNPEDEHSHFIKDVNSLSLSITASFQISSNVWIIRSSPPNFCTTDVYKNDTDGTLSYQYSLENIGQIKQWKTLEQNDKSVTLLAVSTGAPVCGGRGSSLWRAKHPVNEIKNLGVSLPAADEVTIDTKLRHTDIYFKSTDKNYLYKYEDGMINKGETTNQFLNLARVNTLSDGSSITGKLITYFLPYRGHQYSVLRIEGNELYNYNFDIASSVDDVRIIEHQKELVLLVSASRRDLHKPQSNLYITKHLQDGWAIVDNIVLEKPALLMPFTITVNKASYNFFILIQEYSSPVIYEIKGMSSVPEIWQVLDIELTSYVWVEILEELDPLKIILGDLNNSYELFMELNGMNYTNNIPC